MKLDHPGLSSLPPYPNGWYLFCFSDEIPRGHLAALPFMGQQVVVFRSQTGQAYAVDAYCPHLGAHFGYGGTVVGELLRFLPPRLRASLLARGLLGGLVSGARQDFTIWQNKRYIHPPVLAQGDGPIGKYRQWVRQFYSGPD